MQPSCIQIINYLSWLTERDFSYHTINARKAAIVQTLSVCGHFSLAQDSTIIRFMKGVFLAKKPKPKYSTTWDVGEVLDYLKLLYPLEELNLKSLTLKTALVSSKINQMADHGEYVVFTIYELQKTSRPGHEVQVKIGSFLDKRCCVLHTLRQYLKGTKEKRKSDKLLISFKTCNEISTSTVARWLNEILKRSGIGNTIFSAHFIEPPGFTRV
jgi:hypothetical protein